MDKKDIHARHRDRLRKRFLEFGADSLHEHELIELLLFYCIPRKNTNPIAHSLISQFGDTNGILSASLKELQKVDGIGAASASFIRFLGDVCKEYDSFVPAPTSPLSSEDYPMYFRDCFKDTPDGICLILCPGTNCRIRFLKEGLLNGTVDMADISDKLLRRECDKVMIGINKITGAASPDKKDVELVNIFMQQLPALGIRLCDCLIIGKRRSFSLLYDGAFSF